MRVVQIEPGPMPDFDGVGAGVDQRLRAFRGRDVAGDDLHRVRQALDAIDGGEHQLGMTMRGVDDDEIDTGRDQMLGAGKALVADRGRGRDAQAALLVLAGTWVSDRLLNVLDGDQADATVFIVDDQQLFDAVLVQQALGFLLAHAFAHRDQVLLGHQLGHFLVRIGREADVAIGQNADELAGIARAVALHHRNAGNAVLLHQCQARRRALRPDRW